MKRLLSGIKPTGRLHIGNYFGALQQFVALQDTHETFVMVADLHALTALSKPEPEQLRTAVNNLVLDYLGAGLDPEKVTLFCQSHVPAHANLAWVFDCLVTVPYLERAHAYKDAEAKAHEVSAGTFTYPVLMAADILLYNADVVPVGKDQKQHIEYARDIADKFHAAYESGANGGGNIGGDGVADASLFTMPEPIILESVATVIGTDGQKMSKSYNNTIPLFATDEEITKAVMSIVTDSKGKDEQKNPDDIALYQIHKLFNDSAELKARYACGLGYGEAKKLLIADIVAFVSPMRARRASFEQDPGRVADILIAGARRANDIANAKVAEVYRAIGLR